MNKTLAKLIDKLADEHGVPHIFVIRSSAILETRGLEPEDVTELDAHQARDIHADRMKSMANRAGRVFPTTLNGTKVGTQWVSEYPDRRQDQQTKPRRPKLFGFSVSRIIRWMARQDWSTEDAHWVLTQMNVAPSYETTTTQMSIGRKKKGKAAQLRPDQEDQLWDWFDKIPNTA